MSRALTELLTEAIYGTTYQLAPRPRQFTSIFLKLQPQLAEGVR